jgi:hypothetical protein
VDFVDQINFVTALGRSIADVLAQLAHVLHAVVACAINLNHVETVARGDLQAVIAFAARCDRLAFDAIERLRQNSGSGRFANTAWAHKQIRMGEPVLRDRIFQGARNMRLPDQIVESLRPIFSGENLVAHAINLTKKLRRERLRS